MVYNDSCNTAKCKNVAIQQRCITDITERSGHDAWQSSGRHCEQPSLLPTVAPVSSRWNAVLTGHPITGVTEPSSNGRLCVKLLERGAGMTSDSRAHSHLVEGRSGAGTDRAMRCRGCCREGVLYLPTQCHPGAGMHWRWCTIDVPQMKAGSVKGRTRQSFHTNSEI